MIAEIRPIKPSLQSIHPFAARSKEVTDFLLAYPLMCVDLALMPQDDFLEVMTQVRTKLIADVVPTLQQTFGISAHEVFVRGRQAPGVKNFLIESHKIA